MCYARIFSAPEAIVLLIHVSLEMKMDLVAHDDFQLKVVFLVVELMQKTRNNYYAVLGAPFLIEICIFSHPSYYE